MVERFTGPVGVARVRVRAQRGVARLGAADRMLRRALTAVDGVEQERLLLDAAAAAAGAAGDCVFGLLRGNPAPAEVLGPLRSAVAEARSSLTVLHMELQLSGSAPNGRVAALFPAIGESLDDVEEVLSAVPVPPQRSVEGRAADALAAAEALAAAVRAPARAVQRPAPQRRGGQPVPRTVRTAASARASRSPGSRPSRLARRPPLRAGRRT